MDITSIVNLAATGAPTVATILASIVVTVLLLRKDMSSVKKRLERIEQMELSSRLARIEADITWIRAKLEGRL